MTKLERIEEVLEAMNENVLFMRERLKKDDPHRADRLLQESMTIDSVLWMIRDPEYLKCVEEIFLK